MTAIADPPTAEDLQAQYDNPWNALAELAATNEQQADRIDELEVTNERQSERIDALETELDNQSTNVGGAFAKLGAIDDRVEDLEAKAEQSPNNADDSDEDRNGSEQTQAQTPLEQICMLPEHVVSGELSANQERARFIAADVRDYAEKAPAGLVVDSRTIRTVVRASWIGLERVRSIWSSVAERSWSCSTRRLPTDFGKEPRPGLITAVVIGT